MKKNRKDDNKGNMDGLLERLIEKAKKWEAEKDSQHENGCSDQKILNNQETNGDENDT